MNALRTRWQKEQFQPGWLGLLVNPFFFARRGLMRELRDLLPELQGEVLDVGCGRMPYRALVPAARYIGADVDTPVTRELAAADVFYDGRTLPFADTSFDGALCSQVLEHVFEPEPFLREIRRVLRPGGKLGMVSEELVSLRHRFDPPDDHTEEGSHPEISHAELGRVAREARLRVRSHLAGHPDRRKPSGLGGDPPGPFASPSGCPFHPRCSVAVAECTSADVELWPAGDGRRAACVHVLDGARQ